VSRSHPPAPLEGADLAAAPDAQVVAQALTAHQAAAREIVRRYQRPVFNLIVRMVEDAGTAEDLAQEAFTKVFRSLHTFDVRLRFAAWILKIAHNTTIDYLRRHRPHLVPLDVPAKGDESTFADRLPDTAAVSPERAAERQQLRAALDAAIGRLRPEYRRVVVLRYQEDLDYADIAEVMGVPLGTVKTFLHRARQALAGELRRAGWAPGTSGETGGTGPP
jgi:RNA polymerase sigma-70 factor (ECF subfamily)